MAILRTLTCAAGECNNNSKLCCVLSDKWHLHNIPQKDTSINFMSTPGPIYKISFKVTKLLVFDVCTANSTPANELTLYHWGPQPKNRKTQSVISPIMIGVLTSECNIHHGALQWQV